MSTFQLHCSSLGIELLRDDIKFIKAQLSNIPLQLRKQHLQTYADTWLSAMESCDNVVRKMNVGRRAANLFLLGVTDARYS